MSSSGDQRPHVELVIHCHRLTHRVMAKVDTGAECSLIYSKPEQFPSFLMHKLMAIAAKQ